MTNLVATNNMDDMAFLYDEAANYVYHKSLLSSENPFFRKLGEDKIASYNYHLQDMSTTREIRLKEMGLTLVTWGYNEREKEIKALQQLLNTASPIEEGRALWDEPYILNLINKAYNTKTVLSRAIKLIKNKVEGNEVYKMKENEQAFTSASIDAMGKALNRPNGKAMIQIINDSVINNKKLSFNDIRSYWDTLVDDWINILINSAAYKQIFLSMFDLEKEGLALQQAAQLFDDFKNSTGMILKSGRGTLSEETARELMNNLKSRATHMTNKSRRKDLNTAVKIGGRQNNKGNQLSLLAETIAAILVSTINGHNSNGNIFLVARQIGGQGASADSFSIAGNDKMDIEGIISLSFDNIYKEVKANMRAWLKQIEEKYAEDPMPDKFITYESTKLYLEETMRSGFHGTKYTYSSAIKLLEELKVGNAELFLHEVINSTENAILENQQENFTQELKDVVIANVGSFLFDDYWNIGKKVSAKGSTNTIDGIHIFRLSNTVVPLSTLLMGLGRAAIKSADDMDQWATVELTLGPVMEGDKKDELKDRFAAQSAAAIKKFALAVNFLTNFTTIIVGYLEKASEME